MRKLLTAAMTAGLMAIAAPTLAGPGDGPAGTKETNNQVECKSSNTLQKVQVPNTETYVGVASGQVVGCAPKEDRFRFRAA